MIEDVIPVWASAEDNTIVAFDGEGANGLSWCNASVVLLS